MSSAGADSNTCKQLHLKDSRDDLGMFGPTQMKGATEDDRQHTAVTND